MNRKEIGEQIRQIRRAEGMTQRQFIGSIHSVPISEHTLHRIEHGTEYVSLNILVPLIHEIGLSVDEVIYGTGPVRVDTGSRRRPDGRASMGAAELIIWLPLMPADIIRSAMYWSLHSAGGLSDGAITKRMESAVSYIKEGRLKAYARQIISGGEGESVPDDIRKEYGKHFLNFWCPDRERGRDSPKR